MNPPFSVAPTGRFNQIAALGLRLVVGLAIGGLFHYLLYRLSLPAQPFIYASF